MLSRSDQDSNLEYRRCPLIFTSWAPSNPEQGRDLDQNSNESRKRGIPGEVRRASTSFVATPLRELHDRFRANAMPWESADERFGRVATPRAANALEIPPAVGALGMKLEKEEFGVSSVHASLVMFINASIRLTIPAGENPWRQPYWPQRPLPLT